jgi:cytoskeletal protein RodZ
MVQDNRFLAGIAGLDQAVNICNNLSTGNSGQVLSQLCSVIGGLKIINVESICKQLPQQQTTTNGTNQNQNQTLSQGGVVNNNSNNNNNNTNASNSSASSNSLIDKTMGVLKGYLGK